MCSPSITALVASWAHSKIGGPPPALADEPRSTESESEKALTRSSRLSATTLSRVSSKGEVMDIPVVLRTYLH
jgi:hypothetical protein